MAKVIQKLGIKRELGWLYFVDKQGNACRAEIAYGKRNFKAKREVLAVTGLKKEQGKLYFIDKNGDLAEANMTRKRGKAK